MSSKCGSADVLDGLGVEIELDADGVARCLQTAGIGFMFAQKFHPAMRFAGPVRREIGIRTVFNVLGPLANPARAEFQVVGVAAAPLADKLANALSRMGTRHALVVHGSDGMDEISISAPSMVWEVRAGHDLRRYEIEPGDFGIALAPRAALEGGTVAENVATIRSLLADEDHGPRRDIVLLNAAAGLVAAEMAADLSEGIQLAAESLASGAAQARLDRMVQASQAA
jgi:anthranilate phosphoribosyltransferase